MQIDFQPPKNIDPATPGGEGKMKNLIAQNGKNVKDY